VQPNSPEAEIRERDDGPPTDADQSLEQLARLARRLQGLAQHHDVEGTCGVSLEIAIGVALDDRKPVANAGVNP
jgi:hypothetical protein